VPGVKPEDIEVTIEDGILSIKGETTEEHEVKEGEYLMRERRSGSFHRSVRLPDTVDADKAETGYANGVLTIKLPKVEAKKAKRLEVTVGKELKEMVDCVPKTSAGSDADGALDAVSEESATA